MKQRKYFEELRMAQLQAIVELERLGSFASAANALKLSTPWVWQQIRGLETEFDMPLVVVEGQHAKLTEQGALLVEMARPVVQGFDAIRAQFTAKAGVCNSRLTVASPSDILVYGLPGVFAVTMMHVQTSH